MALFESSVRIACTPEAVFNYMIRPANAVDISPPDAVPTLLDTPEVLSGGSRIEFEINAYGQTQRFVHEIVEFEPPTRFVEEQREGPFKLFRHEHVVTPADGGCALMDRIEFEPPGGLLGFLLTEDRIHEMLTAGFEHRHGEMKRRLEQGA